MLANVDIAFLRLGRDPAGDRLIQFNNSGVTIGTDPLKPRIDLWQKVWRPGS